MTKPLVSILITSYNRENYIAASIVSAVKSSYENVEIIIVDDCSGDKTYEIIQSFAEKDQRIKAFRNEKNLGQFQNRNYIATLASGEYLKYLDSDDIIYPYGIEMMMHSAIQFPEAGLFISSNELHETIPFPIEISPQDMYTRFYLKGRFPSVGPSAMLIKTNAFNNVGGFPVPGYVGSDTEFILKLAAKFVTIETEPGVIWYRLHEEQEMAKGIKSNEYIIHDYETYSKLLFTENCPLQGEDNAKALQLLRKRTARSVLRYFKKMNFPLAALIYRKLRPSLSELFSALLN